MMVAVLALGVVAVAAIATALVTRAKLATERKRVALAETAARELEAEIAITREELTSSGDALAAESGALATATEQLEQLRVDLGTAEQMATEADQRARAAAAANGVDPGVVWPLELRRSERVWRYSVSPGRPADSPLAVTRAPLTTALKVEVDAARNDVGADVDLAADLPPEVEPATAMLVLRIAQELLADVVRRSETVTLQVTTDGDVIVVAVEAVGRDGEPVLPEPLPAQSPLLEPIANGVRILGSAPVAEQDSPSSTTPGACSST
jgi:hypothetical protein